MHIIVIRNFSNFRDCISNRSLFLNLSKTLVFLSVTWQRLLRILSVLLFIARSLSANISLKITFYLCLYLYIHSSLFAIKSKFYFRKVPGNLTTTLCTRVLVCIKYKIQNIILYIQRAVKCQDQALEVTLTVKGYNIQYQWK